MKKIIVALMLVAGVAVASNTVTITMTTPYTEAQDQAKLGASNRWSSGNKIVNYYSGLLVGARHATVTINVGSQATETYTY